jgi:hypothetical protein
MGLHFKRKTGSETLSRRDPLLPMLDGWPLLPDNPRFQMTSRAIAAGSQGRRREAPALPPPPAASFYTLTPCRVIDTRDPVGSYGGPALSSEGTRVFALAGQCGIPSSATAVAVNLAVTQPTNGPGFLTLYPAGQPRPLASSINFRAGQTRANNAILALSGSDALSV